MQQQAQRSSQAARPPTLPRPPAGCSTAAPRTTSAAPTAARWCTQAEPCDSGPCRRRWPACQRGWRLAPAGGAQAGAAAAGGWAQAWVCEGGGEFEVDVAIWLRLRMASVRCAAECWAAEEALLHGQHWLRAQQHAVRGGCDKQIQQACMRCSGTLQRLAHSNTQRTQPRKRAECCPTLCCHISSSSAMCSKHSGPLPAAATHSSHCFCWSMRPTSSDELWRRRAALVSDTLRLKTDAES
jgi:hypothetical protein